MSKKEMILANVARWKRDQVRKAHASDPDCPIDNTHVVRAKAVSTAVEDWSIEQKKKWANLQKRQAELKFKPFKF